MYELNYRALPDLEAYLARLDYTGSREVCLETLNALVGQYVNLEYPLPSGASVKFLNDQTTYLGNQLESEFDSERCFGVLANMDFIMICTYGRDGKNPELVLYKKR